MKPTASVRARGPRAAALALAAMLVVAVAGCRGAPAAGGDEGQAAAPTLLVTAARAKTAPIEQTIDVLGTTVALRHVIIRAPAAGRVLDMNLRSGDLVRKGQVVARIINREIEAAEAGIAVARKLDPADAAELARSVGRYSSGAGIAVLAPQSGVVAAQPVASGQMVSDLAPLVDLVDPAGIYVDAAVPVGELHLVHRGMAAVVTSPLRPGRRFAARVAAILPTFNTAGATAQVRIDFTGAQTITDVSAPVQARIVTAKIADAIVVPAAAMFQDSGAGEYHVFVAGADGRAHRTPVKVGIQDDGRAQILSGLSSGALVITSGGYAVSDGLKVEVARGAQ
jgi:membrane fusion protein, multidrug efflux system